MPNDYMDYQLPEARNYLQQFGNPWQGFQGGDAYTRALVGSRNTSNAVNEQKYSDYFNLAGQLGQSQMGLINAQSGQGHADINRRYDAIGDQELMQLARRGLGNSTVNASTRLATEENRSAAINRYDDTMLQRRQQADMQARMLQLQALQSRTDAGPSNQDIAAASRNAAQNAQPNDYWARRIGQANSFGIWRG